MKKISLILLLFTFLEGFGQEIKIDTSYSRIFRERIENTTLISTLKDPVNGIYTIRKYRQLVPSKGWTRGYIIQFWDDDIEPKSYYNYRVTEKSSFLAGAFINEGRLHLLEYVQNRKNKTVECYAHVSPSKDLKFEKKKLFAVDIKKFPGFFSFLSSQFDADFGGNIAFSPNGKKLLFYVDSYSKKEERHALFTFNNALEPLWSREFSHEKKDKLFDLEEATIDDEGTAFIVARIYEDSRRKNKNGKPNYTHELFKISTDDTKITSFGDEKYFINSIQLKLTDSKVKCIGFYSNEQDYQLAGTFVEILNKSSLEHESSNFQKFTEEFLNDKYGDQKKKELRDVHIRSIQTLSNNDMLITAEEIFIEVNFNTNATSSQTYNFDDIAIIKLSESGDMLWARNINKNQESGYLNEVLSFSSLTKENELYLFLNGHKKMGLTGDRTRFKSGIFGTITKGNSVLYVIKFDENGNWTYDIVQENRNPNRIFDARNGIQIDESKILLFGSKDQEKQFLTISSVD